MSNRNSIQPGETVTDGKHTAVVKEVFTSFDVLEGGVPCLAVQYPDGFIDYCTRAGWWKVI